MAADLREEHRGIGRIIEPLIVKAVARYGIRVTENIDLSRLADSREKARVVASALEERTNARGFVLARALREAAA